MGLTFANYVIKPFFPECDVPDDAIRLLAAAAICKYRFTAPIFVFFYFLIAEFSLRMFYNQ